ncbi:hypothetical protein GUITHDRAFT_109599 [Guillardia theta CCMP2712]|uniref:Dynein regulatory complex protein 10 n=1 Tax=Guillardia theta (strain CCMP2712) TaxID=905079 RepID=L1J7G2_GUITC|nr:hypothetical protein GUITHDRAFT_109599 [Guillardia theta CCMP2712]EKX44478.1 hypothetical protein GUITHDRAFT_109599 [Guillardia theta CCMP2712]|eukprot:XP_005831458.1 hypothetical protein GUITHDRAFT_109599 [Guillardia theta CCMP2712]
MEEADASNVAEAERRYLLSLLTMAEELLSLLPETVKKKYGIIKGTLAVRLGSKISNLPKTSNVAEGITSCCEEFARLEVLLEQELQLESNPDVHGNDDLSNPNASNSGTDSRKSKTGSQPGREMRQMEINEIVKERDEARMEIDRLAQELHKSNGLLENAILRALQAEQMKTNYDKWIKETEDQYQATIEMHEHELRSYYEEVMETKLKQAEAEKRECLRNLRSELECKHAKALASAQASYAEKLQAADERVSNMHL